MVDIINADQKELSEKRKIILPKFIVSTKSCLIGPFNKVEYKLGFWSFISLAPLMSDHTY